MIMLLKVEIECASERSGFSPAMCRKEPVQDV